MMRESRISYNLCRVGIGSLQKFKTRKILVCLPLKLANILKLVVVAIAENYSQNT